eukprot:TRINITY_DN974_c0_g1_i21.p1 TRINITY_DN974_c0_g1~~TRINITY_DN974_c0_g1_i21.p1  ORF type:complete len:248 (-),score=90.64 TRINITY_DN974_c0_g1_i21:262-903(-)
MSTNPPLAAFLDPSWLYEDRRPIEHGSSSCAEAGKPVDNSSTFTSDASKSLGNSSTSTSDASRSVESRSTPDVDFDGFGCVGSDVEENESMFEIIKKRKAKKDEKKPCLKKSEDIVGFRGNQDLDSILDFIEEDSQKIKPGDSKTKGRKDMKRKDSQNSTHGDSKRKDSGKEKPGDSKKKDKFGDSKAKGRKDSEEVDNKKEAYRKKKKGRKN